MKKFSDPTDPCGGLTFLNCLQPVMKTMPFFSSWVFLMMLWIKLSHPPSFGCLCNKQKSQGRCKFRGFVYAQILYLQIPRLDSLSLNSWKKKARLSLSLRSVKHECLNLHKLVYHETQEWPSLWSQAQNMIYATLQIVMMCSRLIGKLRFAYE